MKTRHIIIYGLVTIIISAFVVWSMLFENFTIPANSMSPTIKRGDIVLVSKWGFGKFVKLGLAKTEIQRGKIYVFNFSKLDKKFIKRVIALPNDTLEINGHKIIVNGNELKTKKVAISGDFQIETESYGDMTYSIQKSIRQTFPFSRKIHLGKDQYFMLGDNRDNSADSRYFGFVSRDDFVGKLVKTIKFN